MKIVTIYTDGACSGNPGPGGWGAILMYGTFKKELSGGESRTTNNRMELTGVITAPIKGSYPGARPTPPTTVWSSPGSSPPWRL